MRDFAKRSSPPSRLPVLQFHLRHLVSYIGSFPRSSVHLAHFGVGDMFVHLTNKKFPHFWIALLLKSQTKSPWKPFLSGRLQSDLTSLGQNWLKRGSLILYTGPGQRPYGMIEKREVALPTGPSTWVLKVTYSVKATRKVS